jgi:RND superfamily putative drug exporter
MGGAPPPRRPLGVRHPRAVLLAAVVVLMVLAIVGIGVEDKLSATSLNVPGTESSRGDAMLKASFGPSAPFAILLRGPAAALDRQGPRLAAALKRQAGVTEVNPWDRGAGLAGLRPNPRTAVLLADFHVPVKTAILDTAPLVQRIVAAHTRAPVRAVAAGPATVARAILDESVEVTQRGELIVAPILLLVLLLVFRSPIAAVIPLLFGGATVIAARGVISLAAGLIDVNGFALSIATMIGLALGVDYALLIVSRFREELANGADPATAASLTRLTAGRTTVFAGSTLLLAVSIAAILVPGALLLSLCTTVAVVIVIAVAGPWVVAPAILVVLGQRIDRWRIGRRPASRSRWLAASRGALRRPLLATVVIGALLLALALPATRLSTGPVTIEQLRSNDPVRVHVEAIQTAVGGGWVSPAVVVAVSRRGPITTAARLRRLQRWQRRVAAQPGIETVIGPGALARRLSPLRQAGTEFVDAPPPGGTKVSRQLDRLDRASAGIRRLRHGLGVAAVGARKLTAGGSRAEEGAALIARGLGTAAGGNGGAQQALGRFSGGAHQLLAGQRRMMLGISVLGFDVGELSPQVGGQAIPATKRLARRLQSTAAGLPEADAARTVQQLELAQRELEALPATGDPHYAALAGDLQQALAAATQVPGALAASARRLEAEAGEARQLVERLEGVELSIRSLRGILKRVRIGAGKLLGGSRRLAGGADRIVVTARRLSGGIDRLANGAERLSGGLVRLRDGNARLGRGLAAAHRRTQPLQHGADQARTRVVQMRRELRHRSPGLFESGYFALSALDGAPAGVREVASQAIDLERGGRAAKVLVIDGDRERGAPNEARAAALDRRLRDDAARLAAGTGLDVAVTGGVAQSIDYQRATSSRILPLVLAITLATFLALLIILRALPLAALAITLNLFAVAAAFGVLQLLTFLPEDWVFGGARHIDPVAAAGIFGVVFGLSIDYAVFLLRRMRESWEREGDNDRAIAYGIERTATVITGAATIMAVVFTVFATAPIQGVAQFGISLTVAVLLDATVVRLMLVPALMKLIGPRVWWLPDWLESSLPRLDVHGEGLEPRP